MIDYIIPVFCTLSSYASFYNEIYYTLRILNDRMLVT